MIDIVLAVCVCAVTLVTAYLGVHVTFHPADSKRRKLMYQLGFFLCAVVACVLIGFQTRRNDNNQESMQRAINAMSSTLSRLVVNRQPGAISISDKQIVDVVMLYSQVPRKTVWDGEPQFMIKHAGLASQTMLFNQIKTILGFAGVEVAEMTVIPGKSDLPITIKGGSGMDDPEVTKLRLAMSILGINTDYAGTNSQVYLRANRMQSIVLDLQ